MSARGLGGESRGEGYDFDLFVGIHTMHRTSSTGPASPWRRFLFGSAGLSKGSGTLSGGLGIASGGVFQVLVNDLCAGYRVARPIPTQYRKPRERSPRRDPPSVGVSSR